MQRLRAGKRKVRVSEFAGWQVWGAERWKQVTVEMFEGKGRQREWSRGVYGECMGGREGMGVDMGSCEHGVDICVG